MKDVCDFNHLILYAKGHYKVTDALNDTRTILAHRVGLPYESLSDNDVWKMIVVAMEKHCPPHSLSHILHQMFDSYAPFEGFGDGCSVKKAVHLALIELMKITVYYQGATLIELGEADENILPFSASLIESKAKKEKHENSNS